MRPIRIIYVLLLLLLVITVKVYAQPEDIAAIPTPPDIHFKKNSKLLNAAAKAALDSVFNMVYAHPQWNIAISAYAESACKPCVQREWDRVSAICDYLIKKGIKEDRLIFAFPENDDPLVIGLRVKKETGSTTVPDPHPGGNHRN